MVLEAMAYSDGKSAYCRQKGITENLFYKCKNQLLDQADKVFSPKQKETSREQQLKTELVKKDQIISSLVEENLELKKNFGDLM
jgi:transposase-like protein